MPKCGDGDRLQSTQGEGKLVPAVGLEPTA
jgi:hypothetical protein